jgi:hypothetical protein
VLVSEKTLSGEFRVIAKSSSLSQDVGINRDGVPPDQNTLRRRVVEQFIKLMISDLGQAQTFAIVGQ